MYTTARVTETLSYDALNHLVKDAVGTTGQEQYVSDAAGNRVLKRSTSGSTTSLVAYANGGLQELTYTGAGVFSSQLDYYSLAGHLIGSSNRTTTSSDLTNAEGSVLLNLTSSAIQGEQAYGPYGNQRSTQGSIGTDKGYTGQFHDALTGLDFYNARYDDPVAALFLSVDTRQGNAQGMDPYAYVGGNPETRTDPSGQYFASGPPSGGKSGPCASQGRSCGKGAGGSPTGTPANGGCDAGMHLTGSGCVKDAGGGGGGGGGKTGVRPDPLRAKPGCNKSCQISKITNHDYAQEQKTLAWISFSTDATALVGLIIATIVDWGQPQMWVDFAEIIADGIAAIADLVGALGGQVTGVFGAIVTVAKYAVSILDTVRGVFDFVGAIVDPVKGWLKKGVDFFAAEAGKQVKEGLPLLLPDAADAIFYGATGNADIYWNDRIEADKGLSGADAYKTCVADYSVGACR